MTTSDTTNDPLDADPPREAPGVRTDLVQHPDPEALAASFSARTSEPGTFENPPREDELAALSTRSGDTPVAVTTPVADDDDPPREAEIL